MTLIPADVYRWHVLHTKFEPCNLNSLETNMKMLHLQVKFVIDGQVDGQTTVKHVPDFFMHVCLGWRGGGIKCCGWFIIQTTLGKIITTIIIRLSLVMVQFLTNITHFP